MSMRLHDERFHNLINKHAKWRDAEIKWTDRLLRAARRLEKARKKASYYHRLLQEYETKGGE